MSTTKKYNSKELTKRFPQFISSLNTNKTNNLTQGFSQRQNSNSKYIQRQFRIKNSIEKSKKLSNLNQEQRGRE